ncbi:MAG: response regulator transcription factor [Chloroflexi bacterium]|nr:response regulator transcription factor [Chloroflexota bacterium]
MDPIRIMLVEDHQVVREGLRRMLEMEDDMKIVAEASNGQEALAWVKTLAPEVILMDIRMPGMSGIETTRLIKEINPDCKVMVLTLYNEYLPHALESGADGYVLKDVRREELIKAIRDVRDGRSPLHVSMEEQQLREFVGGAYDAQRLSERETEALRLASGGAPSREIAQEMAISETTVKRTLRQAFEKLGARNRSEAVAEAIKRNLI